MSDEELVRRLVRFEGKTCVSSDDEVLAAEAIERLTRERDEARAYAVKRADEAHGIEIALHARADAAERKVEKLREALQDLMDCHHHGDFRNGVTDASGTMDEGEYLAGLVYDRAVAALAETEECK